MSTEKAVVDTPLGLLALEAEDGKLTHVRFRPTESLPSPDQGVLQDAARQIREYFGGTRKRFTIPIQRPPDSSPFQNRVWDALLEIPPGETRTYGEIATDLGSSARAVGGACRRNALPIVIPCHRVVAKSGLGGFSGEWETGIALDVKAELLKHERRAGR